MPVKLGATVLYPAKGNKESQHNPGQFPVKWKLETGDEERTWHYKNDPVFNLRKGARAEIQLNGRKWEVIPGSWDPADLEQPGAPASNGNGHSAPAARSQAPAGQPLDVVGQAGREEAFDRELQMRMKHLNLAITAASKTLAQNTGNWQPVEQDGTPSKHGKVVDPTLLSQEAISKLANTLLMGLYDNRTYLGGGSQYVERDE